MATHTVPQKRPRVSDDFQDTLMCPLCTDYFTPPVIQCNIGHSYCQPCVSKLTPTAKRLCPICRVTFSSGIRNYTVEKLLEKCEVLCTWGTRGCEKLVALTERAQHERTCEFRPQVQCYYMAFEECAWKGGPEALPVHLKQTHGIRELNRENLFRYLWNPPSEGVCRFRFRILNQVVGAASDPFQFILEHYYSSEEKMLVFLVRSCQMSINKKFRLSIYNRQDESNRISYEGTTCSFEDTGHVRDFMRGDLTKMMLVPFQQVKRFCFYCQEDDSEYFSLHIQFM